MLLLISFYIYGVSVVLMLQKACTFFQEASSGSNKNNELNSPDDSALLAWVALWHSGIPCKTKFSMREIA